MITGIIQLTSRNTGSILPSSQPANQKDEIYNLLIQSDQQWDTQQKQLETHKPVFRPNRPNRPMARPTEADATFYGQQHQYPSTNAFSRPPPAGYVCYRCGKTGHYLNMCPTNGNPEFDGQRLKKTTGIPKIFLKTVEKKEGDNTNVMITQAGTFVVAQANDAAWSQISSKSKQFSVSKSAIPSELVCGICNDLMTDAIVMNCCSKNFCDGCIRMVLDDNGTCPGCSTAVLADRISPDLKVRSKIVEFSKSIVGSSKTPSPEVPKKILENTTKSVTEPVRPVYPRPGMQPGMPYGFPVGFPGWRPPFGMMPGMMRPPFRPAMKRDREDDDDVIDLGRK